MKQEDLDYFKNIILQKRDEIIEEIRDAKHMKEDSTSNESPNAITSFHIADIGSDTSDTERKYYFASIGSNQLKELDEALERIENKTFGTCSICGSEISRERLEIVLSATMCIDCKSKEEISVI